MKNLLNSLSLTANISKITLKVKKAGCLAFYIKYTTKFKYIYLLPLMALRLQVAHP